MSAHRVLVIERLQVLLEGLEEALLAATQYSPDKGVLGRHGWRPGARAA